MRDQLLCLGRGVGRRFDTLQPSCPRRVCQDQTSGRERSVMSDRNVNDLELMTRASGRGSIPRHADEVSLQRIHWRVDESEGSQSVFKLRCYTTSEWLRTRSTKVHRSSTYVSYPRAQPASASCLSDRLVIERARGLGLIRQSSALPQCSKFGERDCHAQAW